MIVPTRDSLCSWCQMGAHTECSDCTCTWERDTFYANRVCEWCEDGDCACHDEIVAAAEDATEAAYKDAYAGMSPIEAWNADGNR